MSLIFSKSVVINKPAGEIFSFMADPSNMPVLMPDVVAMEQVGDGPIDRGTRIKETRKMMNREVTAEVEIFCYEPPSRFGVKSEAMGITAKYIYAFHPLDAHTRVELHATMETSGWGKLIAPLFRRSMKKQDADQLQHLKEYFEQETARSYE